jgi:hypothetical protein
MISKYDDVIDSRDVEDRIEELEDIITEHDDAVEAGEEPEITPEEYEEVTEEYNTLRDLREQAEGYCSDWKYGEHLIRDSYFTRYAEELAGEMGAIDPQASWPLNHIDWDAAATELQTDYTAVEFDGVTYWTR